MTKYLRTAQKDKGGPGWSKIELPENVDTTAGKGHFDIPLLLESLKTLHTELRKQPILNHTRVNGCNGLYKCLKEVMELEQGCSFANPKLQRANFCPEAKEWFTTIEKQPLLQFMVWITWEVDYTEATRLAFEAPKTMMKHSKTCAGKLQKLQTKGGDMKKIENATAHLEVLNSLCKLTFTAIETEHTPRYWKAKQKFFGVELMRIAALQKKLAIQNVSTWAKMKAKVRMAQESDNNAYQLPESTISFLTQKTVEKAAGNPPPPVSHTQKRIARVLFSLMQMRPDILRRKEWRQNHSPGLPGVRRGGARRQ